MRFQLLLICSIKICASLVKGDEVAVSTNKVWPAANPLETYGYYDALPMCHPGVIEEKSMTLGQILRGDRLCNSIYRILFEVSITIKPVCEQIMTEKGIKVLKNAIKENFIFEIYVDDLPLLESVGLYDVDETGNEKFYLLNTLEFAFESNSKNVVTAAVILSTKNLIEITNFQQGDSITFYYSTQWSNNFNITSTNRLQKQLSAFLIPQSQGLDIRWLSILNSFVLSIFILALFVLIIFRVVKTDIARFLQLSDEELATADDDAGWKLLHADVFRPPIHRMWLCACLGSGCHLFLVSLVVIAIGCVWPYLKTGAILSAFLVGYLLTSFISGFVSATIYKNLGGGKWAWNLLLASTLFPLPFCVVWSVANSVAIGYGSTAALPFATTVAVFFSWLFVTFPLTLIGGIFGKYKAQKSLERTSPYPCQTNKIPRQIAETTFMRNPWLHVLIAGFVPFTCIYIELYYIYSSLWGTRIYSFYGLLLISYFILLLVSGTLSIVMSYYHLNEENHNWWWRAFGVGGCTAGFLLLHSVYYFFSSSRMHGILQSLYYFGYSLIVAWGFCLILGQTTFFASYHFIKQIYRRAKAE